MKMSWFILALIAMVFFGLMTLTQKHLLNLGIRPIIFAMYIEGIIFLLLLIASVATKQDLKIPSLWLVFLILAAVLGMVGLLMSTYSLKQTPNAGYSSAVISASAIVVFIGSVLLFKSEFSYIKVAGVVLATIGIILIGWK
ncbi:MAG: EamA family transporter [Candidatus Pacearchaeota archaeon]